MCNATLSTGGGCANATLYSTTFSQDMPSHPSLLRRRGSLLVNITLQEACPYQAIPEGQNMQWPVPSPADVQRSMSVMQLVQSADAVKKAFVTELWGVTDP